MNIAEPIEIINRQSSINNGRQGNWLPDMDLNHDKQIQSLLCYRYTIGQDGTNKLLAHTGKSRIVKLGIAEKCKASSVEAESLFRRRPVNTGLQPGAVRRETDLAASAAFVRREKPLKRLASFLTAATGLKPGVNENRPADRDLYEFNGSTF